jgi:hypothetical protein
MTAHTFTNQAEQILTGVCLPARELMASIFWGRLEMLMVEFIQQGTTIMSDMYKGNTKETAWGHSEQMPWNAGICCSASP